MNIILKQDVKGTGKKGDVIKVSDGFARNMLLPKGLAVEATKNNLKMLEKEKAEYEAKIAKEKEEALQLANALEAKTIVIKTKAGEAGKIFGSITSKDIQTAIMEQIGLDIDKKKILLESSIKSVGKFDIPVKLYHEVKGTIKLEIQV